MLMTLPHLNNSNSWTLLTLQLLFPKTKGSFCRLTPVYPSEHNGGTFTKLLLCVCGGGSRRHGPAGYWEERSAPLPVTTPPSCCTLDRQTEALMPRWIQAHPAPGHLCSWSQLESSGWGLSSWVVEHTCLRNALENKKSLLYSLWWTKLNF